MHQGDQIGAGAPFGLDRDLDIVVAGANFEGPERVHAFVDDGERRLAGEFAREMDAWRSRPTVGVLVERDLEHVGRVGRRASAPADVEGDGGLRRRRPRSARRAGSCRISPGPRSCPGASAAMSTRHRRLARRRHAFEVPAPVPAEPLVGLVHFAQRPGCVLARRASAPCGVAGDELEFRDAVLDELLVAEQLLHADDRVRGPDRQGHRAVEGASAGLADAEGDLGFERAWRRDIRRAPTTTSAWPRRRSWRSPRLAWTGSKASSCSPTL